VRADRTRVSVCLSTTHADRDTLYTPKPNMVPFWTLSQEVTSRHALFFLCQDMVCWCILGGVNDDFSEWNYKAMQTSLQDTCDTILYYATCSVHIWTRCFKRTYQHSCLGWRLPVLLQFVVTWPAFIIVNFKAWLMNSEIPSVTARAVARMNCGSCLWRLKSWPHVTAGSFFTVEVIEMCCEFQSVNVSDTKYLGTYVPPTSDLFRTPWNEFRPVLQRIE